MSCTIRLFVEYRLGSSVDSVVQRINRAIGEGYVSIAIVQEWYRRFEADVFTLRDEGERQDRNRKRRAGEESGDTSSSTGAKKTYLLPIERKPVFSLHGVPDFLVKQLARKFHFRQGERFYRSCRAVKGIVDNSTYLWKLEMLSYWKDGRSLRIEGLEYDRIDNFKVEKFYRVDQVDVSSCTPNYIREVVVPELEALGAVGTLFIAFHKTSTEDARLLVAAAKPDTMQIAAEGNDLLSDTFADVKNLHIKISWTDDLSLWTSKYAYKLAINRKTLLLSFDYFDKELIEKFLEDWMSGKPAASLEKLTVKMNFEMGHELEWVWNSDEIDETERVSKITEIENLFSAFDKTAEEYFAEREDHKRLRIDTDFSPMRHFYIYFHFDEQP